MNLNKIIPIILGIVIILFGLFFIISTAPLSFIYRNGSTFFLHGNALKAIGIVFIIIGAKLLYKVYLLNK